MVPYTILGAGIAGLAYANAVGKENAIIYEKQLTGGGLCSSFEINGFNFDNAIHLSFTTNPVVRKWFDKVRYICHKPIAYNFYNGKWMKHPIVNNLSALTVDDKVRLLSSYLDRPLYDSNADDYQSWLESSYGKEITNDFYSVYTKKYWTVEPLRLTTEWIGNRLAVTNFKKMLYGTYQSDDSIDYYAKEMRYPYNGGYQAFLSELLEKANISYKKEVVSLNIEKKEISFLDGSKEKYNHLATSLPLDYLVKITHNVPEYIRKASEFLHCSMVSLVSAGFKKPNISKWLWFYIYDEDLLPARAYCPNLKSSNNVPNGCSSLQFEIYHYPNGGIIDKDKIVENVKKTILKMNLCQEDDILFMDYRLLEYGNVIYEHGMTSARDNIVRYYEDKGIDLIGRFGRYEYYWSDQSFMSGWEKGSMACKYIEEGD